MIVVYILQVGRLVPRCGNFAILETRLGFFRDMCEVHAMEVFMGVTGLASLVFTYRRKACLFAGRKNGKPLRSGDAENYGIKPPNAPHIHR